MLVCTLQRHTRTYPMTGIVLASWICDTISLLPRGMTRSMCSSIFSRSATSSRDVTYNAQRTPYTISMLIVFSLCIHYEIFCGQKLNRADQVNFAIGIHSICYCRAKLCHPGTHHADGVGVDVGAQRTAHQIVQALVGMSGLLPALQQQSISTEAHVARQTETTHISSTALRLHTQRSLPTQPHANTSAQLATWYAHHGRTERTHLAIERAATCGSASGRDSKMTSNTPRGTVTCSSIRSSATCAHTEWHTQGSIIDTVVDAVEKPVCLLSRY